MAGVLHLVCLRRARSHRQGLQACARGGADRAAVRAGRGDASYPDLRGAGGAVTYLRTLLAYLLTSRTHSLARLLTYSLTYLLTGGAVRSGRGAASAAWPLPLLPGALTTLTTLSSLPAARSLLYSPWPLPLLSGGGTCFTHHEEPPILTVAAPSTIFFPTPLMCLGSDFGPTPNATHARAEPIRVV